jgi:hypothetical protein
MAHSVTEVSRFMVGFLREACEVYDRILETERHATS